MRKRARIVGRSLFYGVLPSWVYEPEPHYDCGYWRHLGMNLAYAFRWVTGQETADDRKFEAEVNA